MSSDIETQDRKVLSQLQLKRLQCMLGPILKSNAFYKHKLNAAGITQPEDIRTVADYQNLPFTSKAELSADQIAQPPYGTNLTGSQDQFVRVHQTSGTTGQPLRWMDTDDSWMWFARCWKRVYQGAGLTTADRIFFAFSFGPFIGFWTAHEGARLLGALSISGGSMTSIQRLQAIVDHQATVLVCTPTYALYLAEVAQAEGIDLVNGSIQTTIHAGEPGAGLPATRQRLEQVWGATCYDHAGATEVGAWGFECQYRNGMHVNEGEFIAEVIDPKTGELAEEGELVLTNLGRVGMPVIRYRTGDRVKLNEDACACGSCFVRLDGGVIGRIDDAIIIRGVNVYPSAIENVIRGFSDVTEFAVDVYHRNEMADMEIRLEVQGDTPVAEAVGQKIRHLLGIRAHVQTVPNDTLPRFELKAKRFIDHRNLDS